MRPAEVFVRRGAAALIYAGPPAPGNLIASSVPAGEPGGVDEHGNPYPAGVWSAPGAFGEASSAAELGGLTCPACGADQFVLQLGGRASGAISCASCGAVIEAGQ